MEFAGIDVNPNNSVNNVRTSPMQALKPRISRAGLIGRLSATIGLGIDRPLLTQPCRRAQAFNSRNDASPWLAVAWRRRQPSSLIRRLPKPSLLDPPLSLD